MFDYADESWRTLNDKQFSKKPGNTVTFTHAHVVSPHIPILMSRLSHWPFRAKSLAAVVFQAKPCESPFNEVRG